MITRPPNVRRLRLVSLSLSVASILSITSCDQMRKNVKENMNGVINKSSGAEETASTVSPESSGISTGRLLVLNRQGGVGIDDSLMLEIITALKSKEAHDIATSHVAKAHSDLRAGHVDITAGKSVQASAIDITARGQVGGYVNAYLDSLMITFVESRRTEQEPTESPLEAISTEMGEVETELASAETANLEVTKRVSRVSTESKIKANSDAITTLQSVAATADPSKAQEITSRISALAGETQGLKSALSELDNSERTVRELQKRYDDLLTKMENLDLMGTRAPLSKVAVSIMERATPQRGSGGTY